MNIVRDFADTFTCPCSIFRMRSYRMEPWEMPFEGGGFKTKGVLKTQQPSFIAPNNESFSSLSAVRSFNI